MFLATILIHYGRKQDLSRLCLEFTTRLSLLRKLMIGGLKAEEKEERDCERKREGGRGERERNIVRDAVGDGQKHTE